METKHTPGPWEVELGTANRDWHIIKRGTAWNATSAERDANARLIAAAPDLLAALALILADYSAAYGGDEKDEPKAMKAARAAIAKAEGI